VFGKYLEIRKSDIYNIRLWYSFTEGPSDAAMTTTENVDSEVMSTAVIISSRWLISLNNSLYCYAVFSNLDMFNLLKEIQTPQGLLQKSRTHKWRQQRWCPMVGCHHLHRFLVLFANDTKYYISETTYMAP
jgi:membrane-anchored glycerophosphoryl diester phosphodiesterase (GDPDase)